MSERRRLMMANQDDGILWLYKDGIINTEVTGGLTTNGYKKTANYQYPRYFINPTFENNNIYVIVGVNGSVETCGCGTVNKINLTNYSKLCFEAMRTEGEYNPQLHASYSKDVSVSSNHFVTGLYNTCSNNVVYQKKIDISSKTGDYYISVETNTWGNGIRRGRIYKIWLEK